MPLWLRPSAALGRISGGSQYPFHNNAGHQLLIRLRMQSGNQNFQYSNAILLQGRGKNTNNLQKFTFSTGLILLYDRDAG